MTAAVILCQDGWATPFLLVYQKPFKMAKRIKGSVTGCPVTGSLTTCSPSSRMRTGVGLVFKEQT